MNCIKKLLIAITFLLHGFQVYAYTFSFSNHTNRKLNIRIKLAPAVFEDWLETKELGPKDDPDKRTIAFNVGGRKIGFCLSQIQFSAEDIPWTAAFIQWVEDGEGQQFDRMLKAAALFADGVADIAQDVVYEKVDSKTREKIDYFKKKKEKIDQHITQLAMLINASPDELAQMSRAELNNQVREKFIRPNMVKIKQGDAAVIAQQQKINNLLDDIALDTLDLTNTTESMVQKISAAGDTIVVKMNEGSDMIIKDSKEAASKALVPYAKEVGLYYNSANKLVSTVQKASEFKISDIVHVIGNLIKYSWCKSLHFDVVEDVEGIKFLVKVGQ